MTRDPRIDAYIAAAQPFARPILDHLRAIVHRACPDCVETIRWGFPHFDHDGRIMASMAAFKAHASFGLWHMGEDGPSREAGEGMGQFGRLTSLADLPDDTLLEECVRRAMAAIDRGPESREPKAPRAPLPVPTALAAALADSPAARATFEGFSPSKQRDYCEWIGEAKRPETAARRVAQSIEWLAEGKSRNWKYEADGKPSEKHA